MAVVMMMVAAEPLTQMHDGRAGGGRGLVGHISGLCRRGKGSTKRQSEHSTRDVSGAREVRG